MIYGERITIARELRGWTLEDLANALLVNPDDVIKWEVNQEPPSEGTLKRIGFALAFPTAFFRQPPPAELGPTTLDLHWPVPR